MDKGRTEYWERSRKGDGYFFYCFWRVKREILDDNYEDERDIWNLGQPRNKTLEALSAGTGYSIEELAYILHYWEGKCKKQKKNRNEHKKWLQ